MEGDERHRLILACTIFGTIFCFLSSFSFWILWAVNWRPWRIYSWVYARKWPEIVQGPQLSAVCSFLTLFAWLVVLAPIIVVTIWGSILIMLMSRNIIGLAVIMAGTALLLAFYSIMLWWRTQWQSSRAVAYLLLLAVALLCAYELCAVYVTAGARASEQYSPSGFFFGVSAIALAINMLFICRMIFIGNGFNVDEYVRRSYKFAYSDCVEAGPVACLPEPPEPNEMYMQKSSRFIYLGLLYLGSVLALLVYSILYGLTAKEANWLGAVTSAAVLVLDWNMGVCLFAFEIVRSKTLSLVVAGISRIFLICFGVHYWYLGHCISYAFVASVLLASAVSSRLSVSNPLDARRDALRSTVIRLREGFRRKGQSSSSSSSEGCGSSVKRSSSSVEAGQHGNAIEEICRSNSHCVNDGSSWNCVHLGRSYSCQEGIDSDKNADSGRASLALRSNSSCSILQNEVVTTYADRQIDPSSSVIVGSSSAVESQACDSSGSGPVSATIHGFDLNLALNSQDRLSDPRIVSLLKKKAGLGDQELSSLLQDKGLDPNFAFMLKDKVLDPRILSLLHRSSLDADRDHQDAADTAATDSGRLDNTVPNQISLSEELRRRGWEKWLKFSRLVLHQIAGTAERALILLTLLFIGETVTVAIFRPKPVKVINATHEQFEFGFSVLLLSPVVCSIMAFLRSLHAEGMVMTSTPRKYGFIAWLLSTCVGLLLSFLSKSSVILGLALTFPLMVACLSVAIPIWIRNRYRFWIPKGESRQSDRSTVKQECILLSVSLFIFTGSVLALGAIVSAKPLDDLGYKGWNGDTTSFYSPYATSMYLGWALASAIALFFTAALPIVAWFATYRFSLSSAICVGLFTVVLVAFCGTSYWGVVDSRDGRVPLKIDFLAALLPLICIPAFVCLFIGLYKWKDDDWKLSRGVYVFVSIGLLLLIGGISAVITLIQPWTVGVAFLLLVLLVFLAIGVIHYWASNNFYLTRIQMVSVSFFVFLLALAAFLLGFFEGNPFVGASVGYFSFLFLLAGRALSVLLSPPIVVYSPRVLPIYVYDAHADCAKNVSHAFLILYGIALAIEGWGVIASLKIYPPFAGAATSAITLVVSFGFSVSRPCLTLKMMEDALHFLSKDTVVQAITRSATKTRNALSGTYSAPQRSASSAALLIGDPTITRDRAGNFVLPRDDVLKLRDRLRNEEIAAGIFLCSFGNGARYRLESFNNADYKRRMCAHARILALEEAIDTEWVYMWDKFGGYLLLLLGLTAKAEQVQDEVRLRLFLDSIGLSDLSAKEIKRWMPEDRKQFELIQESYIREKEMEEEVLMQRREEEGKGKERRKALLEKEERKWKEIENSLLSQIPNVGNREAAAFAAAVRAVGGDSVLDDSFARERVSSIAYRIRTAQLARRAEQTGISGAICIQDDEPRIVGRHCGEIHPSICQRRKVTFSIAVTVQPESGPVCLLGTEYQKKVCWEILVAGSEQGIEAGQVGLRLVSKGDKSMTVAKEWSIGAVNIADGRWHIVTVTIDADLGEATSYVDGGFDGYQSGLPLQGSSSSIWEQGTELWIGARPPTDLDAFGRSDSEGSDSKMQIMDAFLWGRCLTDDEIAALHAAMAPAEFDLIDLPEDGWNFGDSPSRVDDWESEEAEVELYDREDVDWDGQYSSGRKRRSGREGVAVDVDLLTRKLRKPRSEAQQEINQRMLSVEVAVKEALLARGETHFTDQEFPPNDRSLYVDPGNPPPKLQVVSEWMRPNDIVKFSCLGVQPCLFSESANSSDVCQGRLGDCWFLSAVAVLTDVSRVSEVIITREFNEEGIYTVRFCIQGEWVPVVVDDWIPCEIPGKPAFATSRKPHELWVPILEKAYAKLHGSYEALEGGLVQDALVDLTGGAGEEIDMRSAQVQIDLASGRLWSQLLYFKREGFLLGAGSPSGSDVHISSSGIVQGHAYSILQVRELDGHKLVQVRNPWANEVEWNGPWSDLSPEWTDRLKHKLKHVPQSKDGIFWMSWQDFQIHFRSIYVCRVYPPEMRHSIHGQWRGYSAGGCQDYESWHQNPQFRLTVTGPEASFPIHVFITLTQGVSFSRKTRGFKNYQSSHDSSMFYIGMRILKTHGRRAAYNIYMHESVGGTDYVNSREISCELVLEPYLKGYTIVPTTIQPGEEAPFVLSVFTKAAVKLEAI